MLQLIPLFAAIAILAGGATLVWYDNLSSKEKDEANALAAEYALTLFNKSVSQLTESQARIVHDRVKQHFN